MPVGGDAPISVQTMTNTDTTDVSATVAQVQAAAEAGADIVRVSTPDEASTSALAQIVKESPVPIVADIHFHYKRAIEAAEAGAACLRINPGNIGSEDRVREVIKAAKDHGCSIRIGVNAGSLEKDLLEKYGEPCPEAMVESGLDHIKILEDNDFHEFKISCKASDVFMASAAYQMLAEQTDAPIHLGITEAGGRTSGTIKSAIGLGWRWKPPSEESLSPSVFSRLSRERMSRLPRQDTEPRMEATPPTETQERRIVISAIVPHLATTGGR